MNIAYLEDDAQQAELVIGWLEGVGHKVTHRPEGKTFLKELKKELFDLAILDWELPDISGIDVIRQLRVVQKQSLPVFFTTQRDAEEDIVSALNSGADDYLVKPVKKGELIARIEAIKRRLRIKPEEDVVKVGNIEIDASKKEIKVDGELVKVTQKEYGIALALFNNFGQVLSREYLLKTIWGVDADINTRTVDMHVSKVRRALKITPETGYRITTVFQHGYRLEEVAN